MPDAKTPNIRIPAEYRKHRELVAVPEDQYEKLKRSKALEPASVKKPTQRMSDDEIAAWKSMFGLLKGRKIPGAAKWQRKIRREWDRPLP